MVDRDRKRDRQTEIRRYINMYIYYLYIHAEIDRLGGDVQRLFNYIDLCGICGRECSTPDSNTSRSGGMDRVIIRLCVTD